MDRGASARGVVESAGAVPVHRRGAAPEVEPVAAVLLPAGLRAAADLAPDTAVLFRMLPVRDPVPAGAGAPAEEPATLLNPADRMAFAEAWKGFQSRMILFGNGTPGTLEQRIPREMNCAGTPPDDARRAATEIFPDVLSRARLFGLDSFFRCGLNGLDCRHFEAPFSSPRTMPRSNNARRRSQH